MVSNETEFIKATIMRSAVEKRKSNILFSQKFSFCFCGRPTNNSGLTITQIGTLIVTLNITTNFHELKIE